MERDCICLVLGWSNGIRKKVMISELSQTKDIIDISYEGIEFYSYPFLIKNGKILDLCLTVKGNGIIDGDFIVVFEHKQTFSGQVDKLPLDNAFHRNRFFTMRIIGSMMLEVSRIQDRMLNMCETFQTLGLTNEKDKNVSDRTCVPIKPNILSSDPLPYNVKSDSTLIERPKIMFKSVKEATEYLKENHIEDWLW